MNITIYRGTHEIGGTLIEIESNKCKILLDAGYPLFLKNEPITDEISDLSSDELLKLGVLPDIKGLYLWDDTLFDAIIISHAHIDHYGLLKYINPSIPIWLSLGTKKIIEISQTFKLTDIVTCNFHYFKMYEPFTVGNFHVMPFLMDHSAFDAAAFEISDHEKIVIYTGDFRGHGRKAVVLDRFINNASKQADALLTEGTMLGRQDEEILTESQLENCLIDKIIPFDAPVLFQSSSQNIDRLVTFFKVAQKLQRLFVVDVYTANVLYELKQLGNNLPYPSNEYRNIRVFYPSRLTQKIFKEIGPEYAKRFSSFHISRDELKEIQNRVIMTVRPSMKNDLIKIGLQNGLFVYSLWSGYRNNEYQIRFEQALKQAGFKLDFLYTSGHASLNDIRKVIAGLIPKKVIPVHTMIPDAFKDIADCVEIKEDGYMFKI